MQFICYLASSADLRQKGKKGASQAAEKEDNCCRSCGTVSLFYCCKLGSWRQKKLYSGTVVYFCVGWVKSSMVLFFSGMTSTVLFFLTWYTAWQHENKNVTKVFNSAARS